MVMENKVEKRSAEIEKEQQPGDMSSFNNRNKERSAEIEGAKKKEKDESGSYTEYNGNSEQNKPAESE
jgi:hypothetical protein